MASKSMPVMSEEDTLKRMIYVMINEASRALEEKIIPEPGSVDLGMILGTGFPPFRGGLLRYADQVGVAQIVQDLNRFQDSVDPKRFEPSGMLRELANDKGTFYRE